MSVTFTILAVLVILASILLTLIVLLQNGKGGGLASNFTAGNQTFGVRQTADLLEKITWGLVAFIFVVSILATYAVKVDDAPELPVQENTVLPSDGNTIQTNENSGNPSDTLKGN